MGYAELGNLQQIRRRKLHEQNGRCYYCLAPVWSRNPRAFGRRHGVTMRSVKLFQCTAEHLTPRCEGGPDSADNIVAACRYCNERRHQMKRPMTHEKYLERVQMRVARGTYRTTKRGRNFDWKARRPRAAQVCGS